MILFKRRIAFFKSFCFQNLSKSKRIKVSLFYVDLRGTMCCFLSFQMKLKFFRHCYKMFPWNILWLCYIDKYDIVLFDKSGNKMIISYGERKYPLKCFENYRMLEAILVVNKIRAKRQMFCLLLFPKFYGLLNMSCGW